MAMLVYFVGADCIESMYRTVINKAMLHWVSPFPGRIPLSWCGGSLAPIKTHNTAGPGQVKSGQDETTTLGPGLMAVFSAPLTTRLSDIVTRSNINTLHRHQPTLTSIHYTNIKQVLSSTSGGLSRSACASHPGLAGLSLIWRWIIIVRGYYLSRIT